MTNDAPARTGRIRSATIDRRCPDLSVSSGLAAYRYRVGRGWQQGAIARSERSKPALLYFSRHVARSDDTYTPRQNCASKIGFRRTGRRENLDTVVNARQLAPLLRSPYEGPCLLHAGGTQGNQGSISHQSEGRQGHGPRIARDWPDSRRRAAGRNRRRTTPNADADPARRFSEGLLLRQIDAFLLRR
jgi:hypothetical protein